MHLFHEMDRYILNKLRERLLDRGSIRNMPEKTLQETLILNTWGTNAIEGNTLTLKEVTRIIETGTTVSNRPVKDLIETVQHSSALAEVVSGNISEINMKSALELHNIIFHGKLSDAGQWRKVNVKIPGSRHSSPRVEKLLSLLQKWEQKYVENELSRDDIFHQAAEMHFDFESIHPFSDGNGRVGRLLLNIHFLNHNWPLVNILPYDRAAYLDALEAAHYNGVNQLKSFLEINMSRSLIFFLDKVGSKADQLMTLQRAKEVTGIDYSVKYMALRTNQGELPGFRWNNVWHTSPAALEIYKGIKGR